MQEFWKRCMGTRRRTPCLAKSGAIGVSTRPWRDVKSEYRASGLTIQAYCERSGIGRSSITRHLAHAREVGQSGDTQHAASATGSSIMA